MGTDGTNLGVSRRTAGLIVRHHAAETLVLDTRNDTVHCLPAEVTRVWDACTADATLAEVAVAAGVDEAVAEKCLEQLADLDLLDAPARGLDRRKFLRRGALVGGGLLAVPAIQTVLAPSALAATSQCQSVTIASAGQVKKCTGSTKAKFTIKLSGCTPNATYYPVFSYLGADGQTHTEVTSPSFLTTGADGSVISTQQITGTFINSGDTTVNVDIYADSAHTILVNTAQAIVGC